MIGSARSMTDQALQFVSYGRNAAGSLAMVFRYRPPMPITAYLNLVKPFSLSIWGCLFLSLISFSMLFYIFYWYVYTYV